MNRKLLVSGIILSLIIAYFVVPPIYNQYQQEQFYNNLITATAVNDADLARVLYYAKQLQDDINSLSLRVTTNEGDITQIMIDIANLQTALTLLQNWQTDVSPIISEYDFIITKDGSDTVAYYGANNTEAFRNTDASTVIQSCVDNRGTIFIKSGTYEITTTITIKSLTTLKGENQRKTVFKAMGNITILNISADYSWSENIYISNIGFTTNTTREGIAVYLDSAPRSVILEQLYMYQLWCGILLDNAWGLVGEKIVTEYCAYGIIANHSSGGGTWARIQDSLVRHSYYDGVKLEVGNTLGLTFISDIVEFSGQSGNGYGFNILGCSFTYISSCHVENNADGAFNISVSVIDNVVIKDVHGYTTENQGSATITSGNNQVWVNHGLVAQPTSIKLTPNGNYTVWYSGLNSTGFYINCYPNAASDLTVMWSANCW